MSHYTHHRNIRHHSIQVTTPPHAIKTETGRKHTQLQTDTGANISATNQRNLLHDYTPFAILEPVGVLSEDDTITHTFQAHGEGYMKIISDQGHIMK